MITKLSHLIPEGGAPIDWQGLRAAGFAAMLADMEKTPQNPAYHAEGDVLEHTKRVCEALVADPRYGAMSYDDRELLFLSALLHDIGKPPCTRIVDGVPTSPYHAPRGASLARRMLWDDFDLAGTPEAQRAREAIVMMVRYHPFPSFAALRDGSERRLYRIAANGELTDAFSVEKLCILAAADIRGRIAPDEASALERVDYCAMLAEEKGCLRAPYRFADPYSARAYFRERTESPEVALYRDTFGEVILMSGLPGTGKDTYIAGHYPDLPMVSLDAIRLRLGIKPTDPQAPVVSAAKEEAREYLRKKQPFVWNATSLSYELRGGLISLFEGYGASVRTVFLETSLATELARNKSREAVVPEPVIHKMLSRLEIPERYECERVEWKIV